MADLDGLLILLALLNLYIVALFAMHLRGTLGGPRFQLAFGACLLWRTERGLKLMDRLARPRAFWKAWGDAGVALTIGAGAAVFLLLIWQGWIFLTDERIQSRPPLSAEQLLVLPGINPLIPVGYGLLALAVALIVHEFMHGVMARAHGLAVKSTGLIFFIVPIGAFVEPDDAELERAPTRQKNRVFAAGVTSNLAVAFVCAVLFSSVFWGSVSIASEGVGVQGVFPDSPADTTGIRAGMIITGVDGKPVKNAVEFNRALAAKHPADSVRVSYYDRGVVRAADVELADRYAYFEARFPDANNQTYWGKPWLGVATINMSSGAAFPRLCRTCPPPSMQDLITMQRRPLDGGLYGFALYIGLPFGGYSPFPDDFLSFYKVQGPLAALPAPFFWILLNSLYWVFWLNLMVGAFNALPAGPLDGGQMFRVSVRAMLRRMYGVPRSKIIVERLGEHNLVVRGVDSDTQARLDRVDRTARTITMTLGLLILSLIVVPLLLPFLRL